MRKLLLPIFIFCSFFAHAQNNQDTPPTGSNFKSISTHSISYYVTDSSVWLFKGATYGWNELTTHKQLKHVADSLGRLGYTKVEVNNLLALKLNCADSLNKYITPYYLSQNYLKKTDTTFLNKRDIAINNRPKWSDTTYLNKRDAAINLRLTSADIAGKKDKTDSTLGTGYTSRDRLATQLALKQNTLTNPLTQNDTISRVGTKYNLTGKVDKITGKKLSTKDYTLSDSTKLAGLAAQQSSDWNSVTSPTNILNKPSIPAAQIQSDWTQASSGSLDYIKNKPTIPVITGKRDISDTIANSGTATNYNLTQQLTFSNKNRGTAPVIIWAGNSLTVGYSSPGYSYPPSSYVVAPEYNGITYEKINLGVGGLRASEIDSAIGARLVSEYRNRAGKNIMIVQIGVNDLGNSVTPGRTYSYLSAFCLKYRAMGYKILVSTLPSSALWYGNPSREPYNEMIRNGYANFADGLIDLGGDFLIGKPTSYSDTTYFTDGVHMTEAGYQEIASQQTIALNYLVTQENFKNLNSLSIGDPGLTSHYDMTKLQVFGTSKANQTVGTERIALFSRQYNEGASFPQSVSFNLGRYSVESFTYRPRTRFDISFDNDDYVNSFTTPNKVLTLLSNGHVGINDTLPSEYLSLPQNMSLKGATSGRAIIQVSAIAGTPTLTLPTTTGTLSLRGDSTVFSSVYQNGLKANKSTTVSGYGITDIATSIGLSGYLPLSAGSGQALTGTLYGTTAIFSNLTANYLPMHTAGGLVNSQIYDNGTNVSIGTTASVATLTLKSQGRIQWITGNINTDSRSWAFDNDVLVNGDFHLLSSVNNSNTVSRKVLSFSNDGNVSIPSATASTSSTTGALVVAGGVAGNSAAFGSLVGTGTRMVVADNAGVISTQAIPSGVGGGTVVSVSVNSSNGFAGTSSGGVNPALTLSTTITGLLLGNGTSVSAVTNNSANWNTAYGWGNHASAGYLTSETDPNSIHNQTGTQSSANFNIDGNGYLGGSITASGGGFNSLRSLKNIHPDWVGTATGELSKFKLRDFNYKTRPEVDSTLGFIIDEIPKSIAKYVLMNNGTAINTYTLHGLEVKAIQELTEKNKELEARIEKLEKLLIK